MVRVAIFASGAGSNAQHIIKYFANSVGISVALIVTNNAAAGVVQKAKHNNMPLLILDKETVSDGGKIALELESHHIDFIVLAGYLKMIPQGLIQAYPEKIINIHPALLPKFGGKGMYGLNVHKAVVENGETETGITIHMVNEKYDEGRIVLQKKTTVDAHDTPHDVENKVRLLEHTWYAQTIENVILQKNTA